MNDLQGDEIVISGISGVFPKAENVQQLSENLFNKVDMVTKTNEYADITHLELPQFMGKVEGMEKFDAHFFRVTARQAVCLDPSIGKLMEHTFVALFDAGINPETLKGSKIGVYTATTQMDTANCFYTNFTDSKHRLSGGGKTMLANRISYWIDGKGPSYCLDNGCAGSMVALEKAYNAMKDGEIDCAVVGGSNCCLLPELSINMKRAGLLCMDGKTKCFDKSGDGYVRSDAVSVYFLQKAKDAKRIYSEIYHVKGKYFASPDGMFTPMWDPLDIEMFLNEFYSEVDVSPADVEYVEANSFGIAESDGNELNAIGKVFAKNKTVKIGSVKSNLGNTEAASGACAVTKLCLAYQKGYIPANLHYNEPQTHINAIKEGKLDVVTENTPFRRHFTAINNFCFTGANFHALLKGHYKPKEDPDRYKSSIPRLVVVSGRKEGDVNKMLDILETNPIDAEVFALLNNFFKHYVPGYTGRGYTILDSNENKETICLSRGFEFYSGTTRPVWFLFSGMGSQWAGMRKDLLLVPVFASAIEKCHKLLVPKGLDIIKILTDKDGRSFNILNTIVAITAVQIGLCDVLTSLGIVPDNIIGHSVGEIACAYADGSLTAEETILASYCRGLAAYESQLINGSMAAVGLGYKEFAKLCPQDIDIACHNSSTSATISGPAGVVKNLTKTLTDQGIFAKEVNSYDIAFHSRYIAEAGPKMLALLKKVIIDPKPRSKKWLTTCYLPEDWHKPESQYVSAEYMVHNLLSSVYFEEAAKFIPDDAIIIEIAPHGLLQAIMKRSHNQCVNLSLTRRGETDGAKFLLKAIANIHQYGLNLDLEALYPKVEFPVSTETSLLSHFVGWDYCLDWVSLFHDNEEDSSNSKEFTVSIYDDDYAYFKDNVRNGSIVLPEAAMLVFVWETLADLKNMNYKDMSVRFRNIKIHEQIILLEEIIQLEVSIQKSSNKFQVTFRNNVIVDGFIDHVKIRNNKYNNIQLNDNEKYLTQNDIYTILRYRGYSYEREFQSIISSNIKRDKACVKWNDQWVTFLDSIIQLKALSNDHDGVSCLKYIHQLTINTDEHKYELVTKDGVQYYDALILRDTGENICGGVILHDLFYNEVSKTEIIPDIQKHLKINVIDHGNSELKTNSTPVDEKNNAPRVELIAKESGNIQSLAWTDASVMFNELKIQVFFSGLSMKDYEKIFKLDNQCFGMDFSGLDRNGNEVMGILPRGAMASTVEADQDLLWPVPQHWTLAEAATVPLPFVQAFYCLQIRCSVRKNSNIFITGATGALGQAVICIALSLGCTIYGTVANAGKKTFLLQLFPELDETNIGYTYDDTFRAMVIERTKNKRCNIVISTSSGKIREAAMGCVGLMGHFLDLNESDQKENKDMRMYFLDPDTSYKSVNISTIFADKYSSKYKKVLHGMLSEGIVKGFVRPLTSVIFSPSDVIKAFKILSTRTNRGRVLINMSEIAKSKQDLVKISRITLYQTKSYIVLWDGSELGIELIDFLIKRGARRLLIHCNAKLMNGYFHVKYVTWDKIGVTIELNSDDLQEKDKCESLINKTETKLGLLDGIFITWNDALKTNNIFDEAKENIAMIVSHLDIASRRSKNLRYFGIVTTLSQSVLSENVLKEIERCCSRRNDLGLPSLFLFHCGGDEIFQQKFVAALFNILETSLKHKYVNVSTSYTTSDGIETEDNNITKLKLNADFGAGLMAFYRHISEDEIDGTEPVIRKKTKICAENKPELTIDPEDSYIIVIPGFEGHSESLTSLSEQLNKRAIVLQLDPVNDDTIPNIAKKLLKYLKATIHVKSPFHLMGYSFGVNIALEIAAVLEKEGLLGVVYCLDSSPDALRVHLDAYLGSLTDEQLQNCLIEHFYKLLVGDVSDELKEKIKKTKKWSEKIDFFISKVKHYVHHSHQYLRSLLHAAYDRIKMAKEYKPTFKLDSELVLLKGIPHPDARKLNDDYNLSMYTDKPVTVLDIESDHAMAQFDCRVPNYINQFFVLYSSDPEIRPQWVKASGRLNWEPTKYSKMVSEHFSEGSNMRISDFVKKLKLREMHSAFVCL